MINFLNIFNKKIPAQQNTTNFIVPQPQKKPLIYKHPGGTIVDPLVKDIINSPNTLIAGTVGSGKSVLLNNIIYNILRCCDINTKLILIDPKMVELSKYRTLPQVIDYADNVQDTIAILDFIIDNMMYRFNVMREQGLTKYNGSRIFVLIDEMADLMTSPQTKIIREKLQKILQLSRAAEIHIIACTQSPSRIVIPSQLVLNFTNRVALRCLSPIESRQIINQKGAELLPQYGKCLYLNSQGIKQHNIYMINNEDIQKAVDNWLYNLKVS